jgi:hypothetical protein
MAINFNRRATPKGSGRLSQRVCQHLLNELKSKYPGITFESEDFWFQKGDYVKSTWDLARWGVDLKHSVKGGTAFIQIYSWDTMHQCRDGVVLLEKDTPHEYEVCAKGWK